MQRGRPRRLGAGGPISSCLGLGTYALSGAYGPVRPEDAMGLLWQAVGEGVTLFDTAASYAGGDVERLLGRVVPAVRDGVLLATRAGTPLEAGDGIREAVEGSLRRLRTDYVDLYLLECPSPRLEDDVLALARLVNQGKVRSIGIMGATADELRRAHAVHPMAVAACEYSLWHRWPERELIPAARALGVGVVAHAPLGRGLTSGRIRTPEDLGPDDDRRRHPWFSRERLDRAAARLRALDEIAADLHMSKVRLALAWLLAEGADGAGEDGAGEDGQGEGIVPVPSTRDPVHLEMNLVAAVRLPPEARARIAEIFPPGSAWR